MTANLSSLYDLWAPTYTHTDNPMLCAVDAAWAVRPMPLRGHRVLELGCGGARLAPRILAAGAAHFWHAGVCMPLESHVHGRQDYLQGLQAAGFAQLNVQAVMATPALCRSCRKLRKRLGQAVLLDMLARRR